MSEIEFMQQLKIYSGQQNLLLSSFSLNYTNQLMLTKSDDFSGKNLNFSNSIKENLSMLHKQLQNSLPKVQSYRIYDSENSESQNQVSRSQQEALIEQNLKTLKNLFQVWEKNQMKSMILYNKLMYSCQNIQYHCSNLFVNTLFHQNLWKLMTYFLQKQLNFTKLRTDNARIVDVWYQFIAIEEKNIYQKVLFSNTLKNINLGEWFRKECLENLFQKFYIGNKKGCTTFFVNFFLYGLAFLFYESVVILRKLCDQQRKQYFEDSFKKEQFNQSSQKDKFTKIYLIETNYINRFQIQSKK